MKRMMVRAMGVVGAGLAVTSAYGQANWGDLCIDPMNMMPRTNPYITNNVFNTLMLVHMGLVGTVTYGGASGPCFVPARTFPIPGRFALSVGTEGSIQQTSANFEDALMALTFGAFLDPISVLAATTRNGTRNQWGASGFSEFFRGFSNRYMSATSTADSVRAKCQVEVVADAARFRWQLTNTGTTASNIGLWFGGAVAMLLDGNASSTTGDFISGFFGKPVYAYLPNLRPPATDTLYDKALNPATFPAYVDFLFGQSDYTGGFRLENGPSEATGDIPTNQPSDVSQFYIGKIGFILGDLTSTNLTFAASPLPDTEFRTSPSWLQVFPERNVEPGQTIQILHYVRSTWGASNYQLPYGVCVDAPKVLGTPSTVGSGQVAPNPFAMRVYVDNVGGYGFDGHEFPLNDVRVKVSFEPTSGVTITGASATVPYVLEKTIPVVQPREDEFIDFQAAVGPNVAGFVPYKVEIFSQPGNVSKTIKGTINVAARARLQLVKDANFVTLPYLFSDSSLETILADFLDPNVPGGDFQAYKWDPIQQGYVITNVADRGHGMWIIYDNAASAPAIANLAGNPVLPGSELAQAPLIQGRDGFNMIGNPYNYQIPINQMLGVSAAAPQTSNTFREMIDLGYVQSFVTRWDPIAKDYVFVDAETGVLEPLQGYWIRVLTPDDLTLSYPAVYAPGVPESFRKPVVWKQTDAQWKLNMAVRSNFGAIDAQNYVGQASSAAQAKRMQASEPPLAPEQAISMSIDGTVNGKPSKMAQTLESTRGRHEWNVVVDTKKAGDLTITWPNLSTLPKSIRLRIVDKSTGVSRFMRQTSGYTFHMDQPGKREFTVTAESGAIATAVIGNVVASQPDSKGPQGHNAPFTVAYTLTADATTSVRVLSASGKEIFTLSRGRADQGGLEHKLVWNLRNNANQAVAPGAYRVEILAETSSGERVRKVVPINVVR